jgi:dTDP-4-dehydrorhamnose reductase
MTRVLVMGAYGLLGCELCPALVNHGHSVLRQGRGVSADYQVDPGCLKNVAELLDATKPEVIVNLIAETNVDACEAEPERAYLANTRPVEVLVEAIRGNGIHLVHISTDQVYSGLGPHREDHVQPCNVYGLSKFCGEMAAATVEATVLRTNFVGASRATGRSGFTDWVVNSLRERKRVTLFRDVLFSPLHISALCGIVDIAIVNRISGTFNVGTVDGLSKADFVFKLANLLNLDVSGATVGCAKDATLVARRPLDMRVAIGKLEQVFGITAPGMNDTIELVARDYDAAK